MLKLFKRPKPVKNLLVPWLTEGSSTMISGWNKMWFILSILDAVTAGKNFGPWECHHPVSCVFLGGNLTTSDREHIECLDLTSKRENALYFLSNAGDASLGLPRANITHETWRKKIKNLLPELGVKLWIVEDTSSPGLERKDWDPIKDWLRDLRSVGITTIFSQHERGASGWEDYLDTDIVLKKPQGYRPSYGVRLGIHFSKHRVSNKYQGMIADMELQLVADKEGYTWEYEQ